MGSAGSQELTARIWTTYRCSGLYSGDIPSAHRGILLARTRVIRMFEVVSAHRPASIDRSRPTAADFRPMLANFAQTPASLPTPGVFVRGKFGSDVVDPWSPFA